MTRQRVFFHHLKPYAFPSSLDELHGPSSGWVELSQSLYGTPGSRRFNLEEDHGVKRVYVSALAEGTPADVQVLVNANGLAEIGDELLLPTRVCDLRETQFLPPCCKTHDVGKHSMGAAPHP